MAAEFDFGGIRLIKEIILRNPQSQLLAKFKEVFYDTREILANRIPIIFGQYTLHDINHSIRIMEYMFDLIIDVKELDELEIIILCYSALLHDIGMAVSEVDYESIKKPTYVRNGLTYTAYLNLTPHDEYNAMQEFIRKIHGLRSNEYILQHLNNDLHMPNRQSLQFYEEVGKICQSHNESFDWISKHLSENELMANQEFNSQYCACLLRLADILDIDDNRTPYKLYEFLSPTGYSKEEWQQHYAIKNDKKILKGSELQSDEIVFSGSCNNPKIHRKLLSYFEWVREEVIGCLKLTRTMKGKYHLGITENLKINIKPKGYTFADYKMHVDFRAVTDLLAGSRLYGNVKYGLRELIQNGLDACKIRIEEERKKDRLGFTYRPQIHIVLDAENKQVKVKDNGIGMDLHIIEKYFLNVGTSYYKSLEFKLNNYEFNPIGNFGIGFLASFMLSSTVRIITKKLNSHAKYEVEVEKLSEYTSITQSEDYSFEGTEIILDYNSFNEAFPGSLLIEIKKFLEENFISSEVSIEIYDAEIKYLSKTVNNIDFWSNEEKIVLTNSLNEFHKIYNKEVGYEGTIEVKKKHNIPVVNGFRDLFYDGASLSKNLYFWEGDNQFNKYDGTQEICTYLRNEELTILRIPFLEEESDPRYQLNLRNAETQVEWLGNTDSAKAIWSLHSLTIIVNPSVNVQRPLFNIVDNDLSLELLESTFNTSKIIDEINNVQPGSITYKGSILHLKRFAKANAYLPVFRGRVGMEFHYNLQIPGNSNRKVFLKGVLIKDSDLYLTFDMLLYSIINFKINIFGNNVYTNVTREKLIFSDLICERKYINDMHQQIINILDFSDTIKGLLQEYLEEQILKQPPQQILAFRTV